MGNKNNIGESLSPEIVNKVRKFINVHSGYSFIGMCLGFYNVNCQDYFSVLYIDTTGNNLSLKRESLLKNKYNCKNVHFKNPEFRKIFDAYYKLSEDISYQYSEHYDEEEYRYTINGKRQKLEDLKVQLLRLYQQEM